MSFLVIFSVSISHLTVGVLALKMHVDDPHSSEDQTWAWVQVLYQLKQLADLMLCDFDVRIILGQERV